MREGNKSLVMLKKCTIGPEIFNLSLVAYIIDQLESW